MKKDPATDKVIVMAGSLVAGCMFILLLSVLISPCNIEGCDSRFWGDLLLDRSLTFNTEGDWSYPFSVQNLMWLMFFLGIGEITIRLRHASLESALMDAGILPEDEETMLRAADLGPIYRKIRAASADQLFFLPRLISRCILQFQASRATEQATSILNSSLELFQHELDLRYSMTRYLIWLIPTLGFIGTVIGIALALDEAGNVPNIQTEAEMLRPWVKALTVKLGVAFYTTLLALLQSSILVALFHIAQSREELALNRAGQYCLDNLINRLYEK